MIEFTTENIVVTILLTLMFKEPVKFFAVALVRYHDKLRPMGRLNMQYILVSIGVTLATYVIHTMDPAIAVIFFGAAEAIVTLVYGSLWQKHSVAAKRQKQQLSASQARYAQLYAEYGIEQAQAAKVNAGR